ncbi:hypothetical protein chiPu_0027439, partial [Chiloscyllium punctatum]|nr:hypothetical protein [Chiloscyllium punctatum]
MAISEVSAEVSSTRTVVSSNCLARDYVRVAQGGPCAVIGPKCGTYILNTSENITDQMDHIRLDADNIQQEGK